jgi:hypothetical protein
MYVDSGLVERYFNRHLNIFYQDKVKQTFLVDSALALRSLGNYCTLYENKTIQIATALFSFPHICKEEPFIDNLATCFLPLLSL